MGIEFSTSTSTVAICHGQRCQGIHQISISICKKGSNNLKFKKKSNYYLSEFSTILIFKIVCHHKFLSRIHTHHQVSSPKLLIHSLTYIFLIVFGKLPHSRTENFKNSMLKNSSYTKKKFREMYVSQLARIFLPGLFKIFWHICIVPFSKNFVKMHGLPRHLVS